MCVIIYTTINNKKILVKNRDRVYKPNIVIIHELVDGVELAYIKDLKTGWIEGLNGNGIGIINSTLNRNDGKYKVDKSYLKMKQNRILDVSTMIGGPFCSPITFELILTFLPSMSLSKVL